MRMNDEKIGASEIRRQSEISHIMRFLALLVVVALTFSLVGCLDDDNAIVKPADYGDYGSELARELAAGWPNRSPGSTQEALEASFIEDAFTDLGYEPELQRFTYYDEENGEDIISSQNIIVRIKGEGFTVS